MQQNPRDQGAFSRSGLFPPRRSGTPKTPPAGKNAPGQKKAKAKATPLDKRSKLTLRQLSKLCDKTEKLCVPIQRLLMEIASMPPHREIRHRLEYFQSRLAIVNAALHQLEDRSFDRRSEGLQRRASRAMEKLEALRPESPQAGPPPTDQATLCGRCPEFPLSGVLLYLVREEKTGILKVILQGDTLKFSVFEGDIVYSSTANPIRGERLGEILIEKGDVKMEHFMAFIDGFRDEGSLLGMALVEKGVVTGDALTGALVEQLQRRLDRVLAAETCRFEFVESAVTPHTGLHINIGEFLVETGHVKPDVAAAAEREERTEWGQIVKGSDRWRSPSTGGWQSPETK